MPEQMSESSTNATYKSSALKQEEYFPPYIIEGSTSYLDSLCQEIDGHFEVDKAPPLTLTVPDDAEIATSTIKTEPKTPIVLSPTSSASSPISTHEHDFTWDSPYTPHTPLQRSFHANTDPITPFTPPESAQDVSKDHLDMVEFMCETPSRKGNDGESNSEDHKQSPRLPGSALQRLQNMIKSSTQDTASSKAERSGKSTHASLVPEAIRPDKDGYEIESIFSALSRRSGMNASDLKTIERSNEEVVSETPASTQPLPALCFDNRPSFNRTDFTFAAESESCFVEDIYRSFTLVANGAAQEIRKPQVELRLVKTETTWHDLPQIEVGFKGKWKLLEQMLPRGINARLTDRPNTCVSTIFSQKKGMAGKMKRCSREHHHRINALKVVVDAIRSCIGSRDYTRIPDHIENIIQAVMCIHHQETLLRKNTANSRIKALGKLIDDLPRCQPKLADMFEEWLRVIVEIGTPGPAPLQLRDARIASPLPMTKTTPYHARLSDDCELTRALTVQVHKPLKKEDRKYGFIYMFWDQQTFGMIKIGRTVNLEQRLKNWNTQCKTTHQYHQTLKDGEPLEIPHVQRIEKLMHIELGNYRRKRICDGCSQKHIEWFDISAEKAKEVYQKWQDWIIQKPYAEDGGGNWVIRPEMLDSLSQVCRPVVFSESKKVPRPRTSRPRVRPKLRRSTASN